jgi:hypothetical protein
MHLLGRGLTAAMLASLALAIGATSALADPIGAPWVGNGTMLLQNGLGGSACNVQLRGAVDGNSVTSAAFSACRGAWGTPTGVMSWAITWNGTNTGGTMRIEKQSLLVSWTCLIGGGLTGVVPFTYSAGTITIPRTRVPVTGTSILCGTQIEVNGSIAI